jgi:hypothetical protein
MPNEPETEDVTEKGKGWDVFYEPTPNYRSTHADGVIVSPNARGNIAVTFYSERLTIPKRVNVKVDGESSNLVETFVEGKQGAVRYFDSTVYLSLELVDELISWLEQAKEFLNDPEQDDNSASAPQETLK